MAIDYTDPPCRTCSVKRDPHMRMLVDHRFRGEHSCEASCDKPARWYVDNTAMCSAHKGNALRMAREHGLPEPRLVPVSR